ncbi:MAG TPA: glycosyltransferase [Acidisphaera sp.]|nr:glycosyltransferase [Acidisphaera sp.]
MTLFAAFVLLLWAYMLFGRDRFWQAGPVLEPADAPDPAPSVAVVVPARNEAEGVELAVRSLVSQDYPGALHVVVVDDDSDDGTGALAQAAGGDRVQVVHGKQRPAGWTGKLWAVSQGLDAAGDSEFVLLTDADIVHERHHVATLVAQAERHRLDMVSEMVRLHCDSFAEHALVPAFVFFFQMLYPFDAVNDPTQSVAAAAGGTMLVRRRALERIGGIAAISGALIDDVALARAIKAGGRIFLGHSMLAESMRAYPRVADVWRMIARSAYVQLRFSPWLLAGTVVGMALLWLAPPALTIFGHGWARLFDAIAWAASAASFLPTLGRFGASMLWALALPVIAVFYVAATIGSAVDHWRGRGVSWRGRDYAGSRA